MTSYEIDTMRQEVSGLYIGVRNFLRRPNLKTPWPSGALWALANTFGVDPTASSPFFGFGFGDLGILLGGRKSFGIEIYQINGTHYPPGKFYFVTSEDLGKISYSLPPNSKGNGNPGSVIIYNDRIYTKTITSSKLLIYFLSAGRIISEMLIELYCTIYPYNGGPPKVGYKVFGFTLAFRQYASNSFPKFTGFNALSFKQEVPTIQIISATDIYMGNGLGQVVYYIKDGMIHTVKGCGRSSCVIDDVSQISLYILDFASVIVGDNCTLADKLINIINGTSVDQQQSISGNIIIYGLTRYILTWLILGVFDTRLLLNRYTNAFLLLLSNSKYSNFMEYFLSEDAQGINLYYKY